MIGEANVLSDRCYYGYDVCLNQECRGVVAGALGIVDFPYTYAGPGCLERIMEAALGRPSHRHGIFAEVNSFTERPVTGPGHLVSLEVTGHPIVLHRQGIRENLTALFDAKYFVKVGGRHIRGNSIIEAISCGVLVLMNPSEVHHSQLLPAESWVHSLEETHEKIDYLERHLQDYERMRADQEKFAQNFVIDAPTESLKSCLRLKRANGPSPIVFPRASPGLLTRLGRRLARRAM
jgi:hypothetical protein